MKTLPQLIEQYERDQAGNANFNKQHSGQVKNNQSTNQPQEPINNTTVEPEKVETPEITQEEIDALKEQDRIAQEGLVEKGLQNTSEVGQRYNLFGEEDRPPETFEELVAEQKNQQRRELKQAQQQVNTAQRLDDMQLARIEDQAAKSKAGVRASLSQGREGPQGTTTARTMQAIQGDIDAQLEENKLRLFAARQERDNMMLQLQEAQKKGRVDLARRLERSLAAADQQIKQNQTNYLNSLTRANDQTLAYRQQLFNEGLATRQEARMAEASQRQNLQTFTSMIESGVTMTTDGLMAAAQNLNVPFELAHSYYQGAESIRQDKSLSLQAKQIALNDLNFDFQEKITGIRSKESQAINDYIKLARSGNYTPEQLQQFAVNMNIPNEANPVYQTELRLNEAKLKMNEAQARIDQYKADHLGKMPPEGTYERLVYDKAQLDLKIAEAVHSGFTGSVPDTSLIGALTPPGQSKYGHGVGKFECGEGFNKITNGKKVGSDYGTKMSAVTKRSNPQVGNGLVIPIGSHTYGHIETVLNYNNITNTIQTISFNRDGRGTPTIETYDVDQLNEMYGNNWGFTDSKLKDDYYNKLTNLQNKAQFGGDDQLAQRAQEYIDKGIGTEEAKKYAEEDIKKEVRSSQDIAELDLTDSQSKIYTAASAMIAEEATMDAVKLNDKELQALDDLIQKGIQGGGFTAESAFASWMATQNLTNRQRRYLAAAARWTNAKLRQESGAAISMGEYMDARSQFFPTFGDSEDAINDKKEARKRAAKDRLDVLPNAAQEKINNRAADSEALEVYRQDANELNEALGSYSANQFY